MWKEGSAATYTVKFLFQNIDDDNYTENADKKRENVAGALQDSVVVDANAQTTTISQKTGTEIEVKYNRNKHKVTYAECIGRC